METLKTTMQHTVFIFWPSYALFIAITVWPCPDFWYLYDTKAESEIEITNM